MISKYTWFILLPLLTLFIPGLSPAANKPGLIYVQVKETKLRSQPQFWSAPVADLTYGTAVESLGVNPSDKSWIKVKLASAEGFLHSSAVTTRKVVLSSSTAPSKEVDSTSVVLAGKGFNRQVEGSYASSKGLDFSSVDTVEKYKVDFVEEAKFISDGGLKGRGK